METTDTVTAETADSCKCGDNQLADEDRILWIIRELRSMYMDIQAKANLEPGATWNGSQLRKDMAVIIQTIQAVSLRASPPENPPKPGPPATPADSQ